MPAYLFTFHAYRSWMFDHKRGYVKRNKGILPTDPQMAEIYKARAKDVPSKFDPAVQKSLLDQSRAACVHIDARFHAGATEAGHIHLLVSWKHHRDWLSMRNSIK